MSHEAKLHQVASVVTQAAVAKDAPSITNVKLGSGLLGVMELRSHSCRCSEDSSLLMLSRTAFFTLVDMTGQSFIQYSLRASSEFLRCQEVWTSTPC